MHKYEFVIIIPQFYFSYKYVKKNNKYWKKYKKKIKDHGSTTLRTSSKLFNLHTVLFSTILLSLVFALPHSYSLLEKKKTPRKFLIPPQQGDQPYHVTTLFHHDSPTLFKLSQNKHYNFTYSLCLYGLIIRVQSCL